MCLHLSVYERNRIIIVTDFISFHFIHFPDFFLIPEVPLECCPYLLFYLNSNWLEGTGICCRAAKILNLIAFMLWNFLKMSNTIVLGLNFPLLFTFEKECSVKWFLQFIVWGQRRYGLLISLLFCWPLFLLMLERTNVSSVLKLLNIMFSGWRELFI